MGKPKKLWCKRYLDTKENHNYEESTYSSTRTKVFVTCDTTSQIPQCQTSHTVQTPTPWIEKLIPVRPKPLYNIGRDLNRTDLDVTPLKCRIPLTVPSEEPYHNNTPERVDSTTSASFIGFETEKRFHKFDPLQYVENHLSNIEITRIHALEPTSVNTIPQSNPPEAWMCNTVQHHNDSVQQEPKSPVTIASEGLHNLTLNAVSVQSKTIRKTYSARSRVRRAKPLIPEDVKDVFYLAGIDESKASQVIVDSNIDNFRETMAKIADEPEKKERFKEVRRQGKNRNAAKKSRKNMLERMRNLKETHKRVSAELSKVKEADKKCQVWREKYRKYSQMHIYWRSYEQERGFQKNNVGGSIYPDGRQYNIPETEYRMIEKRTNK